MMEQGQMMGGMMDMSILMSAMKGKMSGMMNDVQQRQDEDDVPSWMICRIRYGKCPWPWVVERSRQKR